VTDAKAAILARVRDALARTPEEDARARERVAAWAKERHPENIPARGQLTAEDRIGLFIEYARGVETEVERVSGPLAIPAVVSRYLRRQNLPQKLVMAPEPALDLADWASQPLLRIRRGTADAGDAAGLTLATAGVAETGTLLLASSSDRPTLLAFLPETCIIVLGTDRIVGSYEQAIALHLEETGHLPRSLNFVTGPSRTGDIAQKLELGAHGPRRLFVVLVDPADNGPSSQGPDRGPAAPTP
jgi:L-lactate dehydrogenase complex protein LldG